MRDDARKPTRYPRRVDRDEIIRVLRAFETSGLEYVLTRIGEAARFETVDAEIKEIEGARVRVATPAALYHLKKGTVRPQDHMDAAALRERFNLTDEG